MPQCLQELCICSKLYMSRMPQSPKSFVSVVNYIYQEFLNASNICVSVVNYISRMPQCLQQLCICSKLYIKNSSMPPISVYLQQTIHQKFLNASKSCVSVVNYISQECLNAYSARILISSIHIAGMFKYSKLNIYILCM